MNLPLTKQGGRHIVSDGIAGPVVAYCQVGTWLILSTLTQTGGTDIS